MAEASIWESGVEGPPGPPGPAAILRNNGTYIQWSEEGTDIWFNLVQLSTLVGPQGDTVVGPQGPEGPPGLSIVGPQGPAGVDGTDGQDAVPVPTIFGEKLVNNNSTVIAKLAASNPNLNVLSDYSKITGIWTDGQSNEVVQVANGLEITREANYLIQFWNTVSVNTNNTDVAFRIAVNDVLVTGRKIWGRLNAVTDKETITGFTFLHLLPGDVLTVWLASSTSTNVLINDANLLVHELVSTQVIVQEGSALTDPVGQVSFWTRDLAVPAGRALLNGQELTQASFPDFYAALVANNLPTVDEATWIADPAQRWKFVLNSATPGKFRLADYNQVYAGSTIKFLPSVGTDGKWVIKLFGTVTNPGSADAAQLASDFANLDSRVTALETSPSGGGALDGVFYEGEQVITLSRILTAGKNYLTPGPVTLADGVVIQVEDGVTWSVV